MFIIRKQIAVLEHCFDKFNKLKFNGKLIKPVITIQTKGRAKAFGWCSAIPFWKSDKDEDMFEINLCAEYINRSFTDIMETLLHEMCHLHNIQRDIQDVSGNQRHNKKFKEEAERVGLDVEKSPKYGWMDTSLSEELRKEINEWQDIDKTVFNLYRMEVNQKKVSKQKKKYYKFRCSDCDKEIRSAIEDLNCVCEDCNCKYTRV